MFNLCSLRRDACTYMYIIRVCHKSQRPCFAKMYIVLVNICIRVSCTPFTTLTATSFLHFTLHFFAPFVNFAHTQCSTAFARIYFYTSDRMYRFFKLTCACVNIRINCKEKICKLSERFLSTGIIRATYAGSGNSSKVGENRDTMSSGKIRFILNLLAASQYSAYHAGWGPRLNVTRNSRGSVRE